MHPLSENILWRSQFSNFLIKAYAGSLPSNTNPNPKEQVHAIILRSEEAKSEGRAAKNHIKEDDNEEPITK